MADGWIALPPRCPVHGHMHCDSMGTDGTRTGNVFWLWTCPGWDGEGCEHTVLASDLDWRPATDIKIEGFRFSG